MASLNKFTTTACGQNVGRVGVPAALLSVMSTTMKKGANVGFRSLGGRVKTFCPTCSIIIYSRFLQALSGAGLTSNFTRVVGRKLVDSRGR